MALVNSGVLGRSLFMPYVSPILAAQVAEKLQKEQRTLGQEFTLKAVGANEFHGMVSRCLAEVETIAGLEHMKSKRHITVKYRSTNLHKVPVGSLIEEVETRLASWLKSCSIKQSNLKQLDFEDLLGLHDKDLVDDVVVVESLFKNWNDARAQLEAWKKAKSVSCSEDLRKLIKSSHAKLMLADCTWRVESHISEQLSGPACESRTKAELVDLMPTAMKEVKPADALAAFSAHSQKSAFKYAPREVRAAVASCTEWLQSLVAGQQVRLTTAKMTPIAQEVSARLQFFFAGSRHRRREWQC